MNKTMYMQQCMQYMRRTWLVSSFLKQEAEKTDIEESGGTEGMTERMDVVG